MVSVKNKKCHASREVELQVIKPFTFSIRSIFVMLMHFCIVSFCFSICFCCACTCVTRASFSCEICSRLNFNTQLINYKNGMCARQCVQLCGVKWKAIIQTCSNFSIKASFLESSEADLDSMLSNCWPVMSVWSGRNR